MNLQSLVFVHRGLFPEDGWLALLDNEKKNWMYQSSEADVGWDT